MVLLLLALTTSATPSLSMTDVEAPGTLAPLATAVGNSLATEVQRTGVFTFTTPDQLRAVLSLDRQKQLLGCEEGCSTPLQSFIDTRYLLTAKLAHVGDFTLTLTLLDSTTNTRLATETLKASTDRQLLAGLRAVVLKTLAPVLKAESGVIAVRCTEVAAEVKLDDVVVGVTPMREALKVASGVHFVTVTKDGFVSSVLEVRVSPQQLSDVTVRLAPNPDTLAEWQNKQQRLRIAAWSTTSLSAVSFAAGVLFVSLARAAYGSEATGGFLYHRAFLLRGIETEGAIDHRALMADFRKDVVSNQAGAWVAFSVGAAAAIGATVLWLLTDDSDRYDALKPAVGVTLIPGGGFGALSFSF